MSRYRDAKKEAEFWVLAEDFARWLSADRPEQGLRKLKLAVFTKADWIDFTYRGKDGPSDVARSRAFERWKRKKARPRGFVAEEERLGGVAREAVSQIATRLEADIYIARVGGLDVRTQAAIALRDAAKASTKRPNQPVQESRKVKDAPHIRAVQIRLAMLEHCYVLKKAAPALGVTPAKLRGEIAQHGLAEVEAKIRRPGQRPRKITLEKLEPLVREGWSLADMADYLGVKNKSGVKKAIRVLGLEPLWSPAPNPREHDLPLDKVVAILEDAKEREINKSELARMTKIPVSSWRRLAAKHDLVLEWEELQTTAHRGKGEVLDLALTRGILEVAICTGLSANAAAKKYGFVNATVLRRASRRHGLHAMYLQVAGAA